MAGPYSGKSSLATFLRVGAFTTGVVYGAVKLRYLRAQKAARVRPACASKEEPTTLTKSFSSLQEKHMTKLAAKEAAKQAADTAKHH